jgi:hypothetical protein
MRADHTLPALAIDRISLPPQDADGTRCFVHFEPVAEAEAYEVWGSPYADGRGAISLARNWTEPGGQIRGLRPEIDYWLFVTYSRKEGRATIASKPGEGFPVKLKDMFGNK